MERTLNMPPEFTTAGVVMSNYQDRLASLVQFDLSKADWPVVEVPGIEPGSVQDLSVLLRA